MPLIQDFIIRLIAGEDDVDAPSGAVPWASAARCKNEFRINAQISTQDLGANAGRSADPLGATRGNTLALSLLPLSQPDSWAATVLVDELQPRCGLRACSLSPLLNPRS